MRYATLAGGKRLRPFLVVASARLFDVPELAALRCAAAVEMVHTYSLVHDDLPAMDDDDVRRGQPTCHVEFDDATAILAGDALLTLAFETLSAPATHRDPAVRCELIRGLAVAGGPAGMVGGQTDDLASEFAEGDLDNLESIHRRKTGAMFLVALRLGASTAAADAQQQAALEQYGEKLGLAFQIIDDLLDVSGHQAEIGKRVKKDTDRGKLTFPGLLGVEESRRRAVLLCDDACKALAPLGSRASSLEALVRYVVERNH
ncbi:MAG: polyprenyl synthetase family protein [Proteobacteria bacterium]|nr:polyprenyl synthetase family protein [Pseudomonadota bacterium]